MKKGQMFIIAAIVIAIALVSIKGIFGVFTTIEEKSFQEANTLDRQLENIKNEYEYAVNIAWHKENVSKSGIDYLQNLSGFIREETKDTADFETLYFYVYYNNTRKKYTVTVGNFLGDSINATIETMKSTVSQVDFGEIENENYATHEFSLDTQGSYQNFNGINISLYYTIKNRNVSERIILDADKDTSILFYDISIERDNRIRVKDIYSIRQQQFKEMPGSAQQMATCGNNQIEAGEDCCNCPEDVGPCPSICGNGECEICEDEFTCFIDCGEQPQQPYCGDGHCGLGEYCWNCAQDCGQCSGGGGGGCFLSGTMISITDGSQKPVEQIAVGDNVLSFDETTGEIKPGTVTKLLVHKNEKEYLVINGKIKVTPNHAVLSKGKFVQLYYLKVGDTLTDMNVKDVVIDTMELVKETVDVYNFEVALYHTYIANGFVVHNSNKPRCVTGPDIPGMPEPGC